MAAWLLAALTALPGAAPAEEPAMSHKQLMGQMGMEITYYYTDAFGTPIAATDDQGIIIWRISNDPYGENLAVPGAPPPELLAHPAAVPR